LLLVLTGLALIGAPAVGYVGIGSRISLDELALAGAGALGLFIPPQRLVVAMAPAWLLGPFSAEVSAVARAVTAALAAGLVLRFVGGALHLRRAVLGPALFAGALILSLLLPADTGPTPLSRWHDLAGVLIGLAVVVSAIVAPPDLPLVARAIAITGAITAGAVLAGGALAAGRLVGAGANPNYLGGMLTLPCIAAVGLAWHERQPVWLAVAAPSALALVQTQSRGALVAATVGLGCLVLQGRSWGQRAVVAGAAGILSAMFGAVLMRLLIGGRSTTELDANNVIREEALRLALQVAADHPLRGIGYSSFPLYAAASPQIGIFINTHNEYARLACEAGVPAVVLFVVLLVLAMRGRRDTGSSVLRAVVATYAAGLLFGNFLSSMFVSVPFWLALGCLLSPGQKPTGEETPTTFAYIARHSTAGRRDRAAERML
jgi:hypothetical protein